MTGGFSYCFRYFAQIPKYDFPKESEASSSEIEKGDCLRAERISYLSFFPMTELAIEETVFRLKFKLEIKSLSKVVVISLRNGNKVSIYLNGRLLASRYSVS